MSDIETIAKGLTREDQEALVQLADKPSEQGFLISEGPEDDATAYRLMQLGLVNFIRIAGRVMISMREPGLAVRDYLNQQDQETTDGNG